LRGGTRDKKVGWEGGLGGSTRKEKKNEGKRFALTEKENTRGGNPGAADGEGRARGVRSQERGIQGRTIRERGASGGLCQQAP